MKKKPDLTDDVAAIIAGIMIALSLIYISTGLGGPLI